MLSRSLILLYVFCLNLSAKNVTLPSLGKYENVTITKVEGDGVRITHKDGVAKVPLEQVPRELWKSLGLSEEQANDHRQAEAAKKAEEKAEQAQVQAQEEANDALALAKKAAGKPIKGRVLQVFTDGIFIVPVDFTKTEKRTELVRKYRVVKSGTALSGYYDERIPYDVPEIVEKTEIVDSWKAADLYCLMCDTSNFKERDIGVADLEYPIGTHTYESKGGTTNTIPKLTMSYEDYLRYTGKTP